MPSQTDISRLIQQFEKVCCALKERAGASSWDWDGRFSTALVATQDPEHKEMLALLDELFTSSYDSASIRQAPEHIATLSAKLGGMRSGQRMFSLGDGDPVLFGLWWPWDNGTRFSLRVGCHGTSDEAQALDPRALIQRSFGV
ncbi:MAG: hypothetical protein JRH20_08550 [Deltaproteobacteria bacterium]|nr:hypothetical protein [Deltaproteobacteria bacterium]